jgi:hypothetical protein
MLITILYTPRVESPAHPKYTPDVCSDTTSEKFSAGKLAVGIPNTLEPRPNPLITGPPINHGSIGKVPSIQSLNGGKPQFSGLTSRRELITSSAVLNSAVFLGTDGTAMTYIPAAFPAVTPGKESSITRQFEGAVFILFAASENLECHHISRSEKRKYDEFSKSGVSEMIASCNMMSLSYISGDGFPFSTSSPPTIAEKDSFQP